MKSIAILGNNNKVKDRGKGKNETETGIYAGGNRW